MSRGRLLGKDFDISCAWAPVNIATAGATGKRFCMQNCEGVAIVIYASAAGTTDDMAPSLQQHTAYTGGTSADLAIMDTIYRRSETLLDGDEAWTKTTQTAAAIMTAGAAGGEEKNI